MKNLFSTILLVITLSLFSFAQLQDTALVTAMAQISNSIEIQFDTTNILWSNIDMPTVAEWTTSDIGPIGVELTYRLVHGNVPKLLCESVTNFIGSTVELNIENYLQMIWTGQISQTLLAPAVGMTADIWTGTHQAGKTKADVEFQFYNDPEDIEIEAGGFTCTVLFTILQIVS